MDLGAIKKDMAATIEKAKAEDPRELRRRIAELERELNLAKRVTQTKVEPEIIREPVVTKDDFAHLDTLRTSIEKGIQEILEPTKEVRDALSTIARLMLLVPHSTVKLQPTRSVPNRPILTHSAPRLQSRRRDNGPVQAGTLTATQQHILDTVQMLNDRVLAVNRESVARWQAIHPNGGPTALTWLFYAAKATWTVLYSQRKASRQRTS